MSDIKSLLDGITDLAEFSKEDTLRIAKIFEDSADSPLAIVWREIFEKKIKGFYYELAHLPTAKRDIATVSFISGIIQCLEELVRAPKEFCDASKEIKKVDGEKEVA